MGRDGDEERKEGRVNPRPPLYLRIPARVTQLLLVLLACALWPSFGDPLAGRGYVVQVSRWTAFVGK